MQGRTCVGCAKIQWMSDTAHIDSGVTVTVMDKKQFLQLKPRPKMMAAKNKLYAYGD